jgi:hypothetical protein
MKRSEEQRGCVSSSERREKCAKRRIFTLFVHPHENEALKSRENMDIPTDPKSKMLFKIGEKRARD